MFGLGAVLAVILTGQPPFAAASAEATRRQAAQGDLSACFERLNVCGADPELVALCKRCLSSDPAGRPADAGAVAAVVATLRQAADERARRAGLVAAQARTRRKVQLALAGLLGLVLVGGASITWWLDRRAAVVERGVSRALDSADQWAARATDADAETVAGADAAVGLWRQAVAAAEHAEGVATAAGSPNLLARTIEHADRARAGLRSAVGAATRARRDAELVTAIESASELALSGRLGDSHSVATAHASFSRALEVAGIVASTSEALTSALRSERPAVRAVLLPALDGWIELLAERDERHRIRTALDSADDDPFRRQIRSAVVAGDRVLLLQVAARPEVISLPAVTLDQLGRSLIAVQEYAAAERVFRSAREQFPNDYWLTADLGTTLLLRQLIGAAAPAYGRLSTWPLDPARVEEIIGCFRAALALRPMSVVGWMGVAFSLHMLKGDPLGAESAYRKLTEVAPAFHAGHLGLATVLHMKGDLDGAVAAYRRLIEVSTTRMKPLAWVSLGRILERKADSVGAATAYAEAICIDPKNSDALIALIRIVCGRMFPTHSSVLFAEPTLGH